MSRLYLVDGMSHIYRAYYAIQGLTNREGLPTNAVYGFTTMLRKLIADEEPEYLAVALDLPGPTVRHEMYPDYKATRKPMPPDLSQQLPLIHEVCEVFQIPMVSLERYEADDVIGTLTRRAAKQGLDVVIVTIDKDMLQLVDEHTSVLDTRKMTRFDPQEVEAKWGVSPGQIVDVLSLVGDTSDNIPGAPGIGDKGARSLIAEYGSLEALLEHRSEVKRKSYRESLQQNEEQILRSRDLIRIHDDLPVDLDLDAFRVSEPDADEVRELFTRLNFISLVEEYLPTEQKEESCEYEQVSGTTELRRLIDEIRGKTVAADLTFESGNPARGALLSVAFSDGSGLSRQVPESLFGSDLEMVGELLESAASWILHDTKPLRLLLQRYLPDLDVVCTDTKLMAYLISPNQKNFGLGQVAMEQLQLKLKHGSGQDSLFGDENWHQYCEQAEITRRLAAVFEPQLKQKGLVELLETIEMPLVEVLAAMELQGVAIDTDLLDGMSEELQQEIDKLTTQIYELCGLEFNLNSPRQLSEVLFEKMQLPKQRKTGKAGHYSTGVQVLEELAETHEVARLILDYREHSKLKSTYLDALPRLVDPETGRIHTTFHQMVASTGRLSSSNPNLQNIPIRSELGRRIRKAFVAESGFQILAADYSQIELRVMAHLSEDPVLLEAFQKGEDIHDRTAREVFGSDSDLDAHEQRRRAKVINFGIMYGLSAFGLARGLKISRSEAQAFIEEYFDRYRGVGQWIEETSQQVREQGYVTTLFGRIRPIPEIHSRNWNAREFARRTAVNAPIQGTAADLIKLAMVAIYRRLGSEAFESRLILQVHDELVFEARDTELEALTAMVREEMEGVAQLKIPLSIDLGVGPTWYDAK